MSLYLIVYPLLVAAVLAFQPYGVEKNNLSDNLTLNLALGSSNVLRYTIALVLLTIDPSGGMEYDVSPMLGGTTIVFGYDYTSALLVSLSCFLVEPMVLALSNTEHNSQKAQLALVFIATALINAAFTTTDYIVFYVAFEAVLMPLYVMVGLYGGSPTRVRSALLLFLYTLAGSLFMLLGLLSLYSHTGTTDMTVLQNISLDPSVQQYLFVCFGLALLVKTPVVPFHIWLPRAHADAPLPGSMLLAGTVLKLATYGVYRLVLPVLPDACDYFAPLVQTLAVVSLIYSSLATLRSVDTKQVIAYSSVGHMAVVVLGLFSNSVIGISGALLLSLAHGLISPALFVLVGGVLYDRYHTRSITYYRGMASVMPVFTVVFFFAILANMGTPLTANWVGEFMALAGVMEQSFLACVLGATGITFSAAYSVWLWSRISAGTLSPYLSVAGDLTRVEAMTVIPLIVITLVLGIIPGVLLSGLEYEASLLLYNVPAV